jgi:hypothetical protein
MTSTSQALWKLVKRPRGDWTCDTCRRQFSKNEPYWYRKVAYTIGAERAFGIEKLCCGCYEKHTGGILPGSARNRFGAPLQ